MRVWLIKAAEGIPFDPSERLARIGSLAKFLSEHGHEVVWWKSTYLHGEKRYYTNKYLVKKVNKLETVVLLHSKISYKKNVSISRIIHYKLLAKELKKHVEEFDRPDIILCAWPTADFASVAIEYGNRYDVPVVLDVRDMWPDIFERVFPKCIRFLGKTAIYPMKRKAEILFKSAKGITGVNENIVRWACSYAGKTEKDIGKVIFIGNDYISDSDLNEPKLLEEYKFLRDTWNICYIGSLRNNGLDLDTCINAFIKLEKKYSNIKLIIAGDGDSKSYLKSIAQKSNNIIFTGWINRKQMNQVMKTSKIGLYCIKNTSDFVDTFSNKAIQYLSASLPIVSSLNGFSKELLEENNAGIHYEEGDVDDCARVIEKLYLDKNFYNSMSNNAFSLFEKYFESSKVNRIFIDFLKRIIDENH